MIPQNFADAFERVKELVSIFSQNEERYLSPGYSEAQARLDFIDKFWIALGWDVAHENQTDPYKQEVKVERGVATNEWRKRSDYAFLSPNFRDVRFYVEAKKPHAGIDNPDFYFQTIRYGWNSHTPVAVLTDFEELRVLDCRYKPDIRTAVGHAVLKYHYTDYSDDQKFRTIYYLFSRESVLEGSIENFAKGLPKLSRKRALRGAAKDAHQDIDEAFLKELDEYREELARAFKRKNPELESEALTEVTQRTLDRLVFMRFLEDKLIETEPLIEQLHHQRGNAWENFVATSRRLDRVYNGIIFKEHSLLDSPGFTPDGRTFDKIVQNLSHTNSPYDFNAIPIHILGSIYERFLGKVIVATDKRARVEEKPEVRKAGGVYYTPEYIVRYIVDNTVGKLIEGKTPEEIRQMRFADIACGSGSFLLGVYDTLLRYHTAYYNRNKRTQNEGQKAGCLPTETGAMRLSLLQRRTILLNNIYGVDIDPQAVEVAQLSLYLKLLEDETTASAHQQQMALRQALLPSLNKNIVSGNSLIGWDILEGKLFDSGEERKLNPMSFDDAFPEVMKLGGFDAIVGNPPYGQLLTDFGSEYLSKRLKAFGKVKDVYVGFIETAMNLLKDDGRLSFIVPSAWLGGVAYRNLRELLSEFSMESIVLLPFDIFKDAYIDTLIFVTGKSKPMNSHLVRCFVYPKRVKLNSIDVADWNMVPLSVWKESDDKKFVLSLGTLKIIQKLRRSCPTTIGDFLEMKRGVLFDPSMLTNGKTSDDSHPYFEGDVYRYKLNLKLYRWVEFGAGMKEYPKEFKWFEGRRILLRRLVNRQQRLMATFADSTFITNKNLYSLLKINDASLSAEFELFALGVVNSRLISRLYLDQVSQATKDDFPQVTIKDILALPMPTAKINDLQRMIQLVTQMLDAKQQLAAAQTERDKTFYESKCASLDRQIDNLVYELYDLTPEEIAIVEGQSK